MPVSTSSLKSIAWDILNNGYQIDGALDDDGNSLLHLIMKHDLDDEVLMWSLLSRSPAMDLKNNYGSTQLDLAFESGNQNVLQIIHKVISFRKYALIGSFNRRMKDHIPVDAVTEFLPCDNGIFNLTPSKFCLSSIHDDYLDWCEDNTYAQKKTLIEELVSEEKSLLFHIASLNDKFSEVANEIQDVEKFLREKKKEFSYHIWKSVNVEKHRRQRLERTATLVEYVKDEIELITESVNWEGVVEMCQHDVLFLKIWKPVYLTICNSEMSIQDISAAPTGDQPRTGFSSLTGRNSRSMLSFSDIFKRRDSSSSSISVNRSLPVSTINGISLKGYVHADKISKAASSTASTIISRYLDASTKTNNSSSSGVQPHSRNGIAWRRVTLNTSRMLSEIMVSSSRNGSLASNLGSRGGGNENSSAAKAKSRNRHKNTPSFTADESPQNSQSSQRSHGVSSISHNSTSRHESIDSESVRFPMRSSMSGFPLQPFFNIDNNNSTKNINVLHFRIPEITVATSLSIGSNKYISQHGLAKNSHSQHTHNNTSSNNQNNKPCPSSLNYYSTKKAATSELSDTRPSGYNSLAGESIEVPSIFNQAYCTHPANSLENFTQNVKFLSPKRTGAGESTVAIASLAGITSSPPTHRRSSTDPGLQDFDVAMINQLHMQSNGDDPSSPEALRNNFGSPDSQPSDATSIRNYRPDFRGFMSALKTVSESSIPVRISRKFSLTKNIRASQGHRDGGGESEDFIDDDSNSDSDQEIFRVESIADDYGKSNGGGGQDQEDHDNDIQPSSLQVPSPKNGLDYSGSSYASSNRFSDISYTSKISYAGGSIGDDAGDDDGIKIESWDPYTSFSGAFNINKQTLYQANSRVEDMCGRKSTTSPDSDLGKMYLRKPISSHGIHVGKCNSGGGSPSSCASDGTTVITGTERRSISPSSIVVAEDIPDNVIKYIEQTAEEPMDIGEEEGEELDEGRDPRNAICIKDFSASEMEDIIDAGPGLEQGPGPALRPTVTSASIGNVHSTVVDSPPSICYSSFLEFSVESKKKKELRELVGGSLSVSRLRSALIELRDQRTQVEAVLVSTLEARERFFENIRYLQALTRFMKLNAQPLDSLFSLPSSLPPHATTSASASASVSTSNSASNSGSSTTTTESLLSYSISASSSSSWPLQNLINSDANKDIYEMLLSEENEEFHHLVFNGVHGIISPNSSKISEITSAVGMPTEDLRKEFQMVMNILDKRFRICVDLFEAKSRLSEIRNQLIDTRNELRNGFDFLFERLPNRAVSKPREQDLYDIEL